MEKILINSVDNKVSKKSGKPFFAVGFNHDKQATVWEQDIGEFLRTNIGKYVTARVDAGPKFTNIREVQMDVTYNKPTEEAKGLTEDFNDLNKAPQEAKGSSREHSIIAQCFTKCAVEIAKRQDFSSVEDCGKFMCELIPEIHGVYKVALDKLNE